MSKSRDLYQREKEPTKSVSSGKNHLLAIGIDNYKHCTVLNNAVKDARDLAKVLEEKYGFLPEHIKLVTNEEATEFRIFAEFRHLIQKVEPEDNVLIFFSGHGHYDEDFKQGYWIPVDARAGAIGDYIPNSEISTTIRAIPSHHTFMIADACFSGSLFGESRAVYSKIDPSAYYRKVAAMPSRWGLASGRNEIVADGSPGANSPFSENLIYFLQNNIENPFTVSELVQYVKAATANNAEQTPIGSPLRNVGDKGGEFVFYPHALKEAEYQEAIELPAKSVTPAPIQAVPETPAEPLSVSDQFQRWFYHNWKALVMITIATVFLGLWDNSLFLATPALALGIYASMAIFQLRGQTKTIATFGLTLIVVFQFVIFRWATFKAAFSSLLDRTQNHEFLWFGLGLGGLVGFYYFFLKRPTPLGGTKLAFQFNVSTLGSRFRSWVIQNYRILLLIVGASLFLGLWGRLTLFVMTLTLTLSLLGLRVGFTLSKRATIFATIWLSITVMIDFILYDWQQMFLDGKALEGGWAGLWASFLARSQEFEFLFFGLGAGCFIGFLYFFLGKVEERYA